MSLEHIHRSLQIIKLTKLGSSKSIFVLHRPISKLKDMVKSLIGDVNSKFIIHEFTTRALTLIIVQGDKECDI